MKLKRKFIYRKTNGKDSYYYYERGDFRVRLPLPESEDFNDAIAHAEEAYARALGFRTDWGTPRGALRMNEIDLYFRPVELRAKQRAARYGRDYCLPKFWAADQYIRQESRCALSGVVMPRPTGRMDPFAPTIDRIDSTQGYTPENCQLVALQVNLAKNKLSTDEFISMCRRVIKHSNRQTGNRK